MSPAATDTELVAEANKLAGRFYDIFTQCRVRTLPGHRFDLGATTMERMSWQAAVHAYASLLAVDVTEALENLKASEAA